MTEKVLVTGGHGFIGSHLVNYLASKGHWVRSVDIREDCFLETDENEFLKLDLRKASHASRAVEGADLVFNLAADMGGMGYISEFNACIMENNVRINTNMLNASRKANVKSYFFSSSACIYPREIQLIEDQVIPLKEDDALPAHPDSCYGWEKLFTEILCQSYQKDYGMDIKIGRFHNVYGSYCSYNDGREKAPAALCRKVAEGAEKIIVWGDGKQTRSFLYVDDCIDAVYRLIKSDFHEPMNIGTDEWIRIDDLAKMIMKIARKELIIEHDLSKPQGVRNRNADISLAYKVLGWKPKTSLQDGMTSLYRWVEKQVCAT